MGGGQSTPNPPPPPRVIQDPYPSQTGLTNLSLAPGTTAACLRCDIGIDARASTSSVKLVRDFGNISDVECQRYQNDLDAVKAKEMSFDDFFTNLQAGRYSRPVSKTARGDFCEQIKFEPDDAAKVTDLTSFEANLTKLKSVRIRKVTGGGSFSSGTKAKFKLSLPVKAKYVSKLTNVNEPVTRLVGTPLTWQTLPGSTTAAEFQEFTIASLAMYHPSPLRIENVQHDAILSLNDPSDPNIDTVVLIPLKASNTSDESVDFFGKIAKYLTTVMNPDPITGLYPEMDIPTGNDWNIKQVFWLDEPGADNIAKVTDAFFTWTGAGSYSRVEVSKSATEIRYGWKPDGIQVRYFMLQTPVSISTTDLTYLTQSLPPTPAAEAIHTIPDPAMAGNPKVLYKQATGPGAEASCGVVRERMSNQSQGDMLASMFTGGGTEELLVDEKGAPLSDKDSCDPFKMNAKKAISNPSPFSPTRAAAFFFNIMILIAIAIGAWIAMFLVTNKEYDYSFRKFSEDAGKVLAKFALETGGDVKDRIYRLTTRGMPSLPAGLPKLPAGLPTSLPGLPKLPAGLPTSLPTSLSKLSPLAQQLRDA